MTEASRSPLEDREWVYDAYITRGLSLARMAAEADSSPPRAAWWLGHHGIEMRGMAASRAVRPASSYALRGPQSRRWAETVEYAAAHRRVRLLRGRAAEYRCEHCGEQAEQWAYDHLDPEPLIGKNLAPYSLDVSRYIPLCRTCHKRFDMSQRAS